MFPLPQRQSSHYGSSSWHCNDIFFSKVKLFFLWPKTGSEIVRRQAENAFGQGQFLHLAVFNCDLKVLKQHGAAAYSAGTSHLQR